MKYLAVRSLLEHLCPEIRSSENADLQAGDLYLVDHMGLVVLHYPYKNKPEENRLIQKGLLKDLKKLLNYARSS